MPRAGRRHREGHVTSSVDRQIEGLELLAFATAERAVAELAAYSEDDDVATQRVEAAASEPRWIVRVTALDRRMMGTEELVAELLRGELVGPETLVWRGGMENWLPLSRALDLGAAARPGAVGPALGRGGAMRLAPASARRSASVPLTLSRAVAVSLAIAVSSFALTLAALTLGGVFEPPGSGAPPLAAGD